MSEADIVVILMLSAVLALIVMFIRTFSNKIVEPVALFGLLYALVFVGRPASIYLFGFQTWPPFIPDFQADIALLARVEMLALSGLAGVAAVLAFLPSTGGLARVFPHIGQPHANVRPVTAAAALFCGLGLLAAAYIIISAPSLKQLTRFLRVEQGLGPVGQLTFWLIPLGASLAISLALLMLQQGRMARFGLWIGLYLMFGVAVAFMGVRAAIVVPTIALFMGLWLYSGRWRQAVLARRPVKKNIVVLGLLLCLPMLLLLLLNIFRQENTRVAGADQELYGIEGVFISMNLTTFDGFAGMAQLIGEGLPTRDGEDFYLAIIGVIPRFMWPDKPTVINSGVAIAQIFEPTRKLGMPISGPGEWYYNFGLIGPFVGGMVTGLLLAGMRDRYRDWLTNPFSLMLGTRFIVDVLQLGFSNTTPRRYFTMVAPYFAFALAIELFKGGRRSSARSMVRA